MPTRFSIWLGRKAEKSAPILADVLPLADSEDGGEIKQVTLQNVADLVNASSSANDDAIVYAIALG